MIWNLEQFEQNIALIDDNDVSVSYGELHQQGISLSSKIGSRKLVFLLCENSLGSIIGYVGCVNNSIVPILLNAQLDQTLLDNLVAKYKPSFLWAPQRLGEKFSEYRSIYSAYDYSLYQTSFAEEFGLNDELCLMLTTSGSTGSPKFVRQSYENVISNANSIIEYLHLDASERPITTLPMNYTYGLSIINSHLKVGATILVTDRTVMQKAFWTFFNEKKATSFGGVPYSYEILDKLRFYSMDLPSLRYMTQAGGKITSELHKKLALYAEDNNKKFFVMYGQCEATARMGYLPAEKALEKCGSMGIAIPGGKFRLIDDMGTEICNPYTPGELVYYGSNVTLGYAECGEDLIKGDERGGILRTGDVAQMDEDGYYYIVGRMKRFLKIYGNRVNLDEIDRMIKGHFNNIECASAGVDDHMFIFLTDGNNSEEVKEYVSHMTKLNPKAFSVVVIDEIPKNDSGKVKYKELEKYYL